MTEADLREKLRKIEALFSGATFEGEREAAGAALKRMMEKLEGFGKTAPPVEMQFSLGNGYSKKLFMALARRYDLKPYRYKRQKHTTVMLRVPKPFLDTVLWPEFKELDAVLREHLRQITDKIIQDNIFPDISEAAEVRQLTE